MKTVLSLSPGLWLCALISFCVIGSCKKTDDNNGGNGSGYYMKFKLNGTAYEYSGQASGNFNITSGGSQVASMAGLKVALNVGSNTMTLALGTDGDNKTGVTYTNYATTTAGTEKAKALSIVFMDDAGKPYLSWPDEFAAALPDGTKTEARLKVTEATSAVLKGTFSGVLYNDDYTKEFTVTDGEFNLRRIE
ncbi:MAG: hypothetical protein QM802_23845 [Agriterribacter sp.]